MIEAEPPRVDDRAETPDHAAVHQPLQPHLRGCLGQADAIGEIGDGHAAIGAERGDDLAVELVQITGHGHYPDRKIV